MKEFRQTSLEDFYKEAAIFTGKEVSALLPPGLSKEIGHFNVFDIAETIREVKQKATMPYNRRAYYKISLIRGRNRAEYADKTIEIEHNTLLFATPKVPYHWVPLDENQSGSFCVFTADFLNRSLTGFTIDELPIFKPGGFPVFAITDEQTAELTQLFVKMRREIASDYPFKYDLLRNYLMELIHFGQKLEPAIEVNLHQTAASRTSALFVELLERQFPIESPHQRLVMKTAKDYADQLAVHVNHLNKVLKETTGQTTTSIISARLIQEAKLLLKQTDWNVSEIAFSLGFEELAHFSNYFKKATGYSPADYRA